MKNLSANKKRVLAIVAGIVYAVLYGFWTMLATGGGHGNLVWFLLFVFVDIFGLFFPIMAGLGVDLKSRFVKIVFGSLILFNFGGSIVLLSSWVFAESGPQAEDFQKMWSDYQFTVLLCAFLHFLPTLIFTFFLIKSILFGSDEAEDDSMLTLDLR